MHTLVSGGCVRFDRPDGPRLHENAAHVGEYANLWLAWVHAVPCSGGAA